MSMMNLQRTYYGRAKVGRTYVDTGPHETRTEARDAARKLLTGRSAHRGVVSTGYGNGGAYFDIRWHAKTEQ